MKTGKGFTLIELLVVIAIVSLLLTIILPSLKIAKERASEIICENNLRQFGIGMNLYCNDHDGDFSNSEDWLILNLANYLPDCPADFSCVWHNASIIPNGLIIEYLSNDEVRACPAFRRIAIRKSNCTTGLNSTHNPNIPIEPQFTYTQNPFLGKLSIDIPDYIQKITQVKSPSTIFAYGEENPYTIPLPNERPVYGSFSRKVSSNTPLNDCLLYAIALTTARTAITGSGGKYTYDPGFIDCFGSFHRAKDAEGHLGFSKAVFVDGHIQNVQPEESLIYSWPF